MVNVAVFVRALRNEIHSVPKQHDSRKDLDDNNHLTIGIGKDVTTVVSPMAFQLLSKLSRFRHCIAMFRGKFVHSTKAKLHEISLTYKELVNGHLIFPKRRPIWQCLTILARGISS